MDALLQALADIDPDAGERSVPPNPGSCPICNNCEGWESGSVKPMGQAFKVDQWPKPGFDLKTSARNLIDAANDGCPTCSIFFSALQYFLPTIEDDLEITGWLPMPEDSLPMLSVTSKSKLDEKMELKFEFFTTPGNPPHKLISIRDLEVSDCQSYIASCLRFPLSLTYKDLRQCQSLAPLSARQVFSRRHLLISKPTTGTRMAPRLPGESYSMSSI